MVVLVAIGVGGLVGRSLLASVLRQPGVQTWTTIFDAISVQAMPVLVLGVTVSGVIASLVPDGWLTRVLPRR